MPLGLITIQVNEVIGYASAPAAFTNETRKSLEGESVSVTLAAAAEISCACGAANFPARFWMCTTGR